MGPTPSNSPLAGGENFLPSEGVSFLLCEGEAKRGKISPLSEGRLRGVSKGEIEGVRKFDSVLFSYYTPSNV